MRLTKEQKDYFNHLASSKYHLIIKQFQDESDRIGFTFDEITQQQNGQVLVQRIQALGKEIIDSRANSFIETCRDFNVFPDDEDLQAFIDDAKPYVLNRAHIYEDFCKNPFGPNIPKGVSDRILETLKFNLQGIFRVGLYPVEQLLLKGRVVEAFAKDETRKKMRDEQIYSVLKWIYEKANGKQYQPVNLADILEDNPALGGDLEAISNYLHGEGLIKQEDDGGLLVTLEHQGIKEIRNSFTNPAHGTEHFPATVIQNIYNAPVGNVQQGSHSIAHVQQNVGMSANEIIGLLGELRKHIEAADQIAGGELIDGLEEEIKREKPSQSRIEVFLKALGGMATETGKAIIVDLGKKLLTGEIQFPT